MKFAPGDLVVYIDEELPHEGYDNKPMTVLKCCKYSEHYKTTNPEYWDDTMIVVYMGDSAKRHSFDEVDVIRKLTKLEKALK